MNHTAEDNWWASSTTGYVTEQEEDEPVIYIDMLRLVGATSPKLKTANDAIVIIAPIFFVLGTVGNILSFLILWGRKALNKNTTTVYLLTLAVVDQLNLFVGLVQFWLVTKFGIDYRRQSHAGCVFYSFLINFLQTAEPWVLINFTLERVVAVYIPHKSKILFTKRKAVIGLILTLLPIIGLHLHWFWTLKHFEFYAGTPHHISFCAITKAEYYTFVRNTFPTIHLIVQSALPFTVLFVLNILIIIRVFLANLKRKEMNTTAQTKMSSMTAILVVISFTFLAFSLPLVTTAKVLNDYLQNTPPPQYSYDRIELLLTTQKACNIIFYLIYVLNFYEYFVSSPRFRKEMLIMFGVIKKGEKGTTSMATSSASVTMASTTKVNDTKI